MEYKDAKIFLLNAQNSGLGIDIDFSVPIADLKVYLTDKITTISNARKASLAAIFHKNQTLDGVGNYEYCLMLYNNIAALRNTLYQVERCNGYNNNRLAFLGVPTGEVATAIAGTVNIENLNLALPAEDLLMIIKSRTINTLATTIAEFNDQ